LSTDSRTSPDRPGRRLHGRAKGRPLSARKARLIDTRLPELELPDGAVDPRELFPDAGEIWLEIGFGGGEHLIEQAAARPHAGFIGVEPFIDGMAKALVGVEERGLVNVRLRHGDARELVERIAAESLDRIMILFPDPWPKTRHWKRRIISADFVRHCARILKPGGRLRFATDVASYQGWALERFLKEPRLIWTAERANDWRAPPSDHVTTRYQDKRLGDAEPVFFEFIRR